MGPSAAATRLARVLVALDRAGATGVLHARDHGRRAAIALEHGLLRAVSLHPDDGPTLGDLLVRSGRMCAEAHRRALERAPPPARPVASWIVHCGLASAADVQDALRAQLEHRLRVVFGWLAMQLHFESGTFDAALPSPDPPIRLADAVMAWLRSETSRLEPSSTAEGLGGGRLVLGTFGRSLLERAALTDVERALFERLRDGMAAADIVRTLAAKPEALQVLSTWKRVGVCRTALPSGALALLVRKRAELARRVPAPVLLETSGGGCAKRAFSRIARELHPDRFAATADQALHRAAADVLSALTAARHRHATESRLRKHCPAPDSSRPIDAT
ncbi:MAG: hypothetical protein NZ898_03980 [Myxococcota bacterium]|nr:hypothetical protein [Myxococcota bacterium]MDW8362920.1 hypothetical protein [Myxococcales bacterium]